MPIWVQWVSFLIAIVGASSGLYALFLNHQRTTIVVRAEKERLEKKNKAKFSISRIKAQGSKRLQDKFVLQNVGEAEARNIKVDFFNTNRLGDGSKRKISLLMEDVPSRMNAGQTNEFLMGIHGGTAPPWEIVITWDDDFKEGNILETTLT
ncbi:hypothetical protein PO902_14150 [Planococcus maritimus]|nr:hypothetical protein [Planococcus sp. SK3692]MDE4086185.1 hypothetical protein [Planococcus maritimus]